MRATCTGQFCSEMKFKCQEEARYIMSSILSPEYLAAITFTIAMLTFYHKGLAKIQYYHKEHQYPRYLPCTSHSENHSKMLIS